MSARVCVVEVVILCSFSLIREDLNPRRNRPLMTAGRVRLAHPRYSL